jgi:PAS domain S-box-containing protein
MITDTDGNFIDVNASLCKTFGYRKEELLRSNISKLIDPVQLAADPIRFDLLLKGQTILRVRRMISKDGHIIEVECNVKMLPDGMVLAIARDISQRKLTEKALRESENRFRNIAEHAPVAIACYNHDRENIFVNEKFVELTGYTLEDIPNTHAFTALVYPDDKYRQWVYDTWNNVDASGFMKGTGSSKIEVDIRCKNGEYKTVEATRAVFNDLIYVIANDVTESRRAEQKILEQKIQEQKKVSRALLLGGEKERNKIGQELHDNVNQMLATIKLYLNMAKKRQEERGELIEKAEEYIDSAIEEIRMLTKSHVSPRVRESELKDLIQSLIDPLVESGIIDVSFDYANDHPYSLDDDLKLNLYRIIQEQLNNVQKYAMAKTLAVSIRIEKGIILCSVKDNGKGFIVNRKRKGVGLSNIMNRVESFNGTVRIESSPGKGCVLEVEIPV